MFSLDSSRGRGGTSRVCLQEWDGRACPGELPLVEFLGSGKPFSIPKAGSYPLSVVSVLLCVPLREDVYVCERVGIGILYPKALSFDTLHNENKWKT